MTHFNSLIQNPAVLDKNCNNLSLERRIFSHFSNWATKLNTRHQIYNRQNSEVPCGRKETDALKKTCDLLGLTRLCSSRVSEPAVTRLQLSAGITGCRADARRGGSLHICACSAWPYAREEGHRGATAPGGRAADANENVWTRWNVLLWLKFSTLRLDDTTQRQLPLQRF